MKKNKKAVKKMFRFACHRIVSIQTNVINAKRAVHEQMLKNLNKFRQRCEEEWAKSSPH